MSFLGGKKENQKANAATASEERQRNSSVCEDKQQTMELISSVSSVGPARGLQVLKAAVVPEGGRDTTKDQQEVRDEDAAMNISMDSESVLKAEIWQYSLRIHECMF